MGKPISQVRTTQNAPKWEDDLEWTEFPNGELVIMRLVGGVDVLSRHWLQTMKGANFPVWCPKFDSNSEEFDPTRICPAHDDFELRSQKMIIGQAILRKLQLQGVSNPVRAFMIPGFLQDDLNTVLQLMGCDPADPDKGYDIAIKYDKGAKPKVWSLHQGRIVALTDIEKSYKLVDMSKIIPNFGDPAVMAKQARSMKDSMVRNCFYVTQIPGSGISKNNPWAAFKGTDPEAGGVPWTQIPELAAFEKAQEDAQKKPEDNVPTGTAHQPPPDKVPTPPPALAPAPQALAPQAPPPAPVPQAPQATPTQASSIVLPEGATIITWKDKQVPNCYTKFDGSLRCNKCGFKQACIRDIPEE